MGILKGFYMQTITLETDIAQDGTLNICVPSGLPPGRVEVLLVIQPKTSVSHQLLHKQQVYPGDIGINTQPAYANGNSQNDKEIRLQQGKRMMELLAIALKGVEWREIEEGRTDDANRC